jgi:hypothetical protein
VQADGAPCSHEGQGALCPPNTSFPRCSTARGLGSGHTAGAPRTQRRWTVWMDSHGRAAFRGVAHPQCERGAPHRLTSSSQAKRSLEAHDECRSNPPAVMADDAEQLLPAAHGRAAPASPSSPTNPHVDSSCRRRGRQQDDGSFPTGYSTRSRRRLTRTLFVSPRPSTLLTESRGLG